MSCVNTLTYDLSAYLANTLSPPTGNSDFTLPNSDQFRKNSRKRDNHMLRRRIVIYQSSHQLSCISSSAKTVNDPSLPNRTTQTPNQITDILNFASKATYFQYNGSTYEQTGGATMGNPVIAVIANFYMESFKDHAVTSPYKTRIWKRYVEETFTILAFDSLESFLKHLNHQ